MGADVRSKKLYEDVLAHFGRVDISVNFAGTGKREPAMECPERTRAAILESSLMGTARC
jgi:NAD(P)-dependent dehydrogenase (short-subunit alcohol dehydrogenase family)